MKAISAGLALLLASTGGPYATGTPALPKSVAAVGQAFARESKAYDLLEELTTRIGQRLSATANGEAAEAFVYEKLKTFGFKDVRYEPFPMTSWTRGALELDVDGAKIASAALVYSPAQANLSAEIVDVGNGVSADYAFDYDKVRGKIALAYIGVLPNSPADTPKLPRWEKLALAIGHGATGLILISSTPGDYISTGIAGGSAKVVDIPVVMISNDSGVALKHRLEAGPLGGHIRMTNTVKEASARNVIATIKGTAWPEEVIVLGGHLDSLDLGTGAVDDGTGSMWVLDVARGLKAHGFKPKRTVQFMFFMGEEAGLLGSYAHVRKAASDGSLRQVKYMINTDMSMDPTSYNLWGGEPDKAFFEALAGEVRRIHPAFQKAAAEKPGDSQSSDSQAFLEQGVPIAYPRGTWPREVMSCIHAKCDTMQWVTREGMARSAGIGAMLVAALADASAPVARRFDAAETAAYYKAEGIDPVYKGPAPPR